VSDHFPDQPTMEEGDNWALMHWADLRLESNLLAAAGAKRNAGRHAAAWGLKLFATLLQERPDLFTPRCNPGEALKELLREAAEPGSPLRYTSR